MMKKRILAILLAALMTASLSACVQSNKRPPLDNPGSSGTESNQVRDPDVTDPIVTVTWSDKNDQVFIIKANTTLTPVEEGKSPIKATLLEQLERKQISSDNKKSIVEKDGVLYTVNNDNITNEDLTGAGFAGCDEVMYVKHDVDVLNLRPYASSDNSISPSQGTLTKGDAVKVVAKGEKWCKIEVLNPETQEPVYYFVSLEYLSVNNDGPVDYTQFFVACDPTVVMYVYNVADGQGVNLRTSPSAENNTNVAGGVMKDSPVTVLAKGTGDYASWYYVRVANATVPGMSQTYSEYYINASYLTEEKPILTLEELIAKYGFTAGEKTLYATGSINVRKTPVVEEGNIVLPGLTKGKQVKVVASGLVEGQLWSIIEHNTGTVESPKIGYYFVRGSYEFLTTDPSGEILPTLEGIIAEYPTFSMITEKTVYANTKTYGFDSIVKAPTVDDEKVTIAASTSFVAVAEGSLHGADWYIVRDTEGKFYFVFAEFFDDMQAAG